MIEYSNFEGAAKPMFDADSPWDETDSTHLWIVNRGAILAASGGGFGKMFCDLFKPDPKATQATDSTFHNNLCRGLYNADYVDFFNGPPSMLPDPSSPGKTIPYYQSHFYDPDTGLNYRGNTITALYRGRNLFNASLNFYFIGDLKAAAYTLGLSLHYLTDLGQPMHAANYTAADFPIKWHTNFEHLVMANQNKCVVNTVLDSQTYQNVPDDYFTNMARTSKPMFKKYNLNNEQSEAYVETFLSEMLNNVIQTVAHYVTKWMELAEGKRSVNIDSICAAQQGYKWKQNIFYSSHVGIHFYVNYMYRDVTFDTLPGGSYADFPQINNPKIPPGPLELTSCVVNYDDGVGLVFERRNLPDEIRCRSQVGQASGWSDPVTLEFLSNNNFTTICACNFAPEVEKQFDDRAVLYAVRSDGTLLFTFQTNKWKLPYLKASEITWTQMSESSPAPKNITHLVATSAILNTKVPRLGALFAISSGDLYVSYQSMDKWAGWQQVLIDTSASGNGDFSFCTIAACQTSYTQIWFTDQYGHLMTSSLNASTGKWSDSILIAEDVTDVTATTSQHRSDSMSIWFVIGEKLFYSEQDNSGRWGTEWKEYPQ